MLPLIVNIGFQVLFHSPPGVLFTFPSRYFSAIGHQVVFSLGGWSPLLPTGFLVSRGTLGHGCAFLASLTGLLPSLVELSSSLLLPVIVLNAGPQPRASEDTRFGLFPFRSPLLGKSMFLSLPPAT